MATGIANEIETAGAEPRAHGLRDVLKGIRNAIGAAFVSPLLIPFALSDQKELILSDVRRWNDLENLGIRSERAALLHLLCFYKEYRNLYYYRLRHSRLAAAISAAGLKLIYPERSWLAIRPQKLGPGFFIQHGFGSNINGESIGANCRVNQQVTIGYGNGDRLPRIGDNVHIAAGARVFGDVTIGDNVKIGANAVVTKSVPPDCTVVGVPAYIVKRDGVRVREEL